MLAQSLRLWANIESTLVQRLVFAVNMIYQPSTCSSVVKLQFEIIINVIVIAVYLFTLHLNTFVMGLRPLEILYHVYFFCAGIDFRRQNMTSRDDGPPPLPPFPIIIVNLPTSIIKYNSGEGGREFCKRSDSDV